MCIQLSSRLFGQPRFLLHDGIAAGVFNMTYNGGTGVFHQWQKQLPNSQEVVDFLLRRMRQDFEVLNVKMRKPWNQASLDSFQTLVVSLRLGPKTLH